MTFGISRKLTLMIGVAVTLSILAMSLQLYSLHKILWKDRQDLIATQVESTMSMLAHFAAQADAGAMTLDEAQTRAKEAARAIRYGDGDYVFMYDPQGNRVMHPDTEREGTNAWEATDANGKLHIREMIQTAQAGGGFTDYHVARLSGGDPQPKLSYSALFQPWDWTVGAGLYVDDINADFMAELQRSGIWSALLLAALIACAVPLSRSISRPIKTLTAMMGRLAQGQTDLPAPGAARRDEIGAMARAVETFRAATIDRDRLSAEAEAVNARQAAMVEETSRRATQLQQFVAAISTGFDTLSRGDLTVRITQDVAPEFEAIKRQFNDSLGQLDEALGTVVEGVGIIRAGLAEISAAAHDLAHRTEQQAANLEETVAALTEVSRGVDESAEGASSAQTSAETAQHNAQGGGEIVQKAVSAVGEIEESTQKIGTIVTVIDEIAFQTNLLALNAGIEAARAGEAGRGFAVVAHEVRALAHKSAEAAHQIKDLIGTSNLHVREGADLVRASGTSLVTIVEEVSAVRTIITMIASRTREQSQSLRSLSAGADQMDKVTQQNAAMVEQTTAAARALEEQTDQLAGKARQFRTSPQKSMAGVPASHHAAVERAVAAGW
ncbi:methyl-accepting chemotaxis protein [Paracoccus hibiscisoli]|uniref:HAMP domain-containing protein n=1 Tax=Paracoccus hibiscisoli TaxID=2023261 RepID=A0A4V5MTN0_9RHOB|nr:methyl-accepting chemotaxis protein [Paracoccus hibiscisoli]TJZ84438.1 HAMP domain-containing protein [Paracoccus hibiscisoli]